MAERYLIDTCAVIKYLTVVFPQKGITFIDKVVDSESIISFISESAIINNLTLISDNDKDFKKVLELKYINPNSMI